MTNGSDELPTSCDSTSDFCLSVELVVVDDWLKRVVGHVVAIELVH